MNATEIPTLTDQVPQPLSFPWPEIRDFIAVFNALAQTQQNTAVGEQMAQVETDEAKKAEIEGRLTGIRKQGVDLQLRAQQLNDRIEAKLRSLETAKSRLILPH